MSVTDLHHFKNDFRNKYNLEKVGKCHSGLYLRLHSAIN